MAQRPFEVVVFGATGFTGQLVATYLARRYAGLRWAIAGRDRAKLAALRDQLAEIDPALSELSLLVADGSDAASVRELAEQTVAIASTAGPFARHGSELVAACVERGTHYCDITGEVQWVQRMIHAHHRAAEAAGVRIVHCCGYDAVPSDLGVFALERHAREAHGGPALDVLALSSRKAPGFSGGTYASALMVVDEAIGDPAVRNVLADPFALAPQPDAAEGNRREPRGPRYRAEAGVFTAPSINGPANARVVHRTNGLLQHAYGRAFSYEEVTPTGGGVLGALHAAAVSAGLASMSVGLLLPPARALARRLAPKPGEGPSEEARANSSFALEFYGRVGDKKVRARFGAAGDPAYGETAKQLAESVLCLARDGATLPLHGGVLTPGAAMGARLIERLRAAGTTVSAWTEA
ncbi:MAG: saccharopine dehydrogenase NADP-binding domain-containing protein [Polyangiales bacterium]